MADRKNNPENIFDLTKGNKVTPFGNWVASVVVYYKKQPAKANGAFCSLRFLSNSAVAQLKILKNSAK